MSDALTYLPLSMTGVFEGLPAALKRLRERRRLSVAELSRRSGVRAARLSDYEAGRRQPNLDTLGSMMGGLGVDLETLSRELAGGSSPPLSVRTASGLIQVGDSGVYMSEDAAADFLVQIVKSGASRMDPPPRAVSTEPPPSPLPRPARVTAGGSHDS